MFALIDRCAAWLQVSELRQAEHDAVELVEAGFSILKMREGGALFGWLGF